MICIVATVHRRWWPSNGHSRHVPSQRIEHTRSRLRNPISRHRNLYLLLSNIAVALRRLDVRTVTVLGGRACVRLVSHRERLAIQALWPNVKRQPSASWENGGFKGGFWAGIWTASDGGLSAAIKQCNAVSEATLHGRSDKSVKGPMIWVRVPGLPAHINCIERSSLAVV